jgi:Leucine-rich repeat (LRR) protein
MKEKNITDRLSFLAELFDVFECDENDSNIEVKISELTENGYLPTPLLNGDNAVIAIVSQKQNEKERTLKKISICSEIFGRMIIADPTENKIYLQWMLNLFSRLLKEGNIGDFESAIRLVDEDLPQANKYLTLFEENKRKKKFKELCKGSYILKGITDPTDINQYKSLSQLFDSVDPFIEKDASAIERTMQRFVDIGQALIPVKDRKFTLFIPKSTEANVIFEDFANWCTARKGNGMFNSYTTGHKKPNGKNSDIYIIINNQFFEGKSKEIYQIHFETNQLKDSRNGQNVSIFESVLSESEGLSNFFHDELLDMAKSFNKGLENNKYLDFLIQFGFAESLFELLDVNTPAIRFMTREIPKLPDISHFKALDQLIITNAKLTELHPSIGKLTNLEMLVLTENNLKELPKEIGNLKKLWFLNINGNEIKTIPSEISYLDKSNGGSLFRVGVKEEDIGAENYQRLKLLLPTTIIG